MKSWTAVFMDLSSSDRRTR